MSLFEELAVKMGHVASTCEKRKTLISANGLNMMGYVSGINRQKHGKKDYSNGIAPNALVQMDRELLQAESVESLQLRRRYNAGGDR
jgi:hypothetical protein